MQNEEPEFGWRDMTGPASSIIPPAIDIEAANRIEQLERELALAKRKRPSIKYDTQFAALVASYGVAFALGSDGDTAGVYEKLVACIDARPGTERYKALEDAALMCDAQE